MEISMKVTDFSRFLHKYLTSYLPKERGCSQNTIDTYRYTFIVFLEYLESIKIKTDRFEVKDFNYKLIISFLDYLENDKKASISTRNNRLATILSFVRFHSFEYPDYLDKYNEILEIPFKKTSIKSISHLDIEGLKLLMSSINRNSIKGYRDYMIIFILYETGVRVSELVNIKIKDFHFTKPYYLKVLGKGSKERIIPIAEDVIKELKRYLEITVLDKEPVDSLLFTNRQDSSLTRMAINNILKKYADTARKSDSTLIPEKITPHIIRHSKAMHLLQSGVNIVYIRDFLGHSSIQTTEIYARANSKAKQEAIESSYTDIYPSEKPKWQNKSTLEWLKRFN